MRSFVAFTLPVAIAAGRTVFHARVGAVPDQKWSYLPDKTADWYSTHGKNVPELAPAVTTVEEGQSYVVKLDCLGCPFRVRSLGEVYETWQEPAQDNSLLLNFTVDGHESTLLLNGQVISPAVRLPLDISAFQTPANLTKEIMGKMASQKMLDSSWRLGTKYGTFELQYEHTLLATEQPGEEWVQFDVIGAHRRGINPGSGVLDKDGQKMVQLLLRQDMSDNAPTLSIKDIQVVERKNRVQPLKMKCGKLAIISTVYDPREWDYYGQFGTFSRSWSVFVSKTLGFFWRSIPLLIIFSVVFSGFSIVRRVKKRNEERKLEAVKDDAEAGAALLAPEYDNAPPEYVDASETSEEKEEEKE